MNRKIAPLLIALALLPAIGRAADVQSFLVTKGQQLLQTNANAPALDATNTPHRFFSAVDGSTSNSLLGVSLKVPNASIKTFTNEDGGFTFQQAFTNKTQLDAGYGAGTYAFTIQTLLNGTNRPALKLPPDAYPNSPHIANWQDAQTIEATLPFILYWDPFVGGTTNDFVQLDVENASGELVASSPGLFHPDAINGTNGSAIIPADRLDENQTYRGRLLFVKSTTLDTTNIPGAIGMAGYYRETTFPLTTLPAAGVGGRVQFSASTFADSEAAGDSVVVTVTRTGSEAAMNVQVAMTDGTATSGLDYINSPATVNFAKGATNAQVSIPLLDDYLLETNETIFLTLSSPSLGTLGPRSNAVFTIVDNELVSAGKIQFTAPAFAFAESARVAQVKLTRLGGSTGTASVAYHTVAGTAAENVDFIPTNGVLNFASGQTTNSIIVPLIGDALDETNEIFWVILDSTTGGAALGTNHTATITITDDDTAGIVAFKSATFSTNENAASALITVARTKGAAGNVTVDFATANGTATAGSDYFATNGTLTFGSNELIKTFSVALINDFETETNETVLLSLSNPTGGAKLGPLSNATLRIIDEDSKFSFTNASYVVGEAGKSVSINIFRTGSLITTSAVTFATANVTATSTNDYRGTNGTFVFPANTKFKTLIIPIYSDTLVESNETFTLTLSNPLNGAQLGDIPVTTITITNDDLGGVIFFSTNNYSVNENGTNAIITVNRTNGLASAVSVDFITANGSATAGTDYSNATQTVTFLAGETSKKVLIRPIDNTVDQPNKTVLLALTNPQGGGILGAQTNATLTILDNDSGGVIAFKSANFSATEGSGGALITVTRTNGVASGVSVDYRTRNGTADDSSDYDETHDTLTFGAGETNKTFFVTIHDDLAPEGNETVLLELSDPTGGATLGAISNATLTILDDESSFAFSNATYTVSEAGPSVAVSVIRSGGLVTPASVQFFTTNGTALAQSDYLSTNGTLNFAAGIASQTIKIPVLNDTLFEDDETFGIRLINPTGGAVLGVISNTTVTITNNDFGGAFKFNASSYTGSEGSNVVVTISRTGGVASGVTVQFTIGGGSATKGVDYAEVSSLLTFGAGETSKKVTIPIYPDLAAEPTETANLKLSDPTGGATLGSPDSATLNIINQPNTNGIPLAGTPFFTLTMTGTNAFTFDSSIAITNIGTQASGNSADSRTNYYTNLPVFSTNIVGGVTNLIGQSNTTITARSERWVHNIRENNYRVITDQIRLVNFKIPQPGDRTLSQGLPGTLVETFSDVNGSVLLSNYQFEWESGTITFDEVDYAPDGTVRGFSGRMNIIAKSPVSAARVLLVGSFRYHP